MSATDLPAPTTPLDDPLESLSGVGAARARALRAAGLATLSDLLRRFPRGHDHLPAPSPAEDLPAAGVATVVGPIRSRRLRSSRRGRGGHLEVELDAGRSGLRFTL
ncbi:MAG: hypothetical protein R3F20_12390 [Planctomycetota bacterium]